MKSNKDTTPKIPGYTIKKVLGEGGMATVYLAVQETFERHVALKVLSLHLLRDKSFGQRFLREAKLVANMSHPNIIPVYDVGKVGDYHYIAMSDHGEGNNRELNGHQVGFAHFAYVTSNIDAVILRLEKAGFSIAKDGSEEPHRKNIYFTDPAGFEIEFVQYLSDIPQQRNLTT